MTSLSAGPEREHAPWRLTLAAAVLTVVAACQTSRPPPADPEGLVLRIGHRTYARDAIATEWPTVRRMLGSEVSEEPDRVQFTLLKLVAVEAERAGLQLNVVEQHAIEREARRLGLSDDDELEGARRMLADQKLTARHLALVAVMGHDSLAPLLVSRKALVEAWIRERPETWFVDAYSWPSALPAEAESALRRRLATAPEAVDLGAILRDATGGDWMELRDLCVSGSDLTAPVREALRQAVTDRVLGPFRVADSHLVLVLRRREHPGQEAFAKAVPRLRSDLIVTWTTRALLQLRRRILAHTTVEPLSIRLKLLRLLDPPPPTRRETPASDSSDRGVDEFRRIHETLAQEGVSRPDDTSNLAAVAARVRRTLVHGGHPEARVAARLTKDGPRWSIEPGPLHTIHEFRWSGFRRAEIATLRNRLDRLQPGDGPPGLAAERRWIAEDGNLIATEPLDRGALQRTVRFVRRFLEESGYRDARVRARILPRHRGPVTTLSRLFPDPIGNLLGGHDLLAPLVDGLVSTVAAPAVLVGWREPEVQATVTLVASRGARHRIRRVRVACPDAPHRVPRLVEIARTIEGRPARQDEVGQTASRLRAELRREGLAGSTVQTSWIPILDDPRAWDIEFRVVPGRPIRVTASEFRGATETLDSVLDDYVTLVPGDILDEDRLEREIGELERTGFIERAWPEIEEVPGEEGGTVVVQVRDRLGGRITPQGGVDQEGRPTAQITFALENFRALGLLPPGASPLVGGGERLGLQAAYNAYQPQAAVLWEKPRALSRHASVRVEFRGAWLARSELDWHQYRATLLTPTDLGSGLRISPGIGLGLDHYSDLDRDLPDGVREFRGSRGRVGALVRARWRPPGGSSDSTRLTWRHDLGVAALEGASTSGILNYGTEARTETDLSELVGERLGRPVLRARLGLAIVRPLGGDDLPWGDHLRAGGPLDLRGFAPNGIGPTYAEGDHLGARNRLSGSIGMFLEMSHSGSVIPTLEAFLDVASLEDSWSADLLTRPSISTGLSIHLGLPIFGIELGLHFGHPLRREDGDDGQVFQLSISMLHDRERIG